MKKRKVIYIDKKEKVKTYKLVLTHVQSQRPTQVWTEGIPFTMQDVNKIVYLGNCDFDGDMFAVYVDNRIYVCLGNLNSGKY